MPDLNTETRPPRWSARLAAGVMWMREALNAILGKSQTIDEFSGGFGQTGFGLASVLNALDWDHVRAEVERESRAHVVLIGAVGAGKSTLLHHLKGFIGEEDGQGTTEDESPTTLGRRTTLHPSGQAPDEIDALPIENWGLFSVIDVPASRPNSWADESGVWLELENADLIVWVLDATTGVRTWEYEWISRVRALGKALIVVANKLDALADAHATERWARLLGGEIISVSARDGTNVATRLLPRMADASPNLATALGREVAAWRRTASQRVMRRAATLSGLAGLEPVPLLDIPFQIFIQLQMVLRIAAIYGQPLTDRYSREMLATMVTGVALRFVGQQLVKLVPLAGWLASGALAATGTYAIGRIAVEYFERGRRVPLPRLMTRTNGVQRATAENGQAEPSAIPQTPAPIPPNMPSRWANWKKRFSIPWARKKKVGSAPEPNRAENSEVNDD